MADGEDAHNHILVREEGRGKHDQGVVEVDDRETDEGAVEEFDEPMLIRPVRSGFGHNGRLGHEQSLSRMP